MMNQPRSLRIDSSTSGPLRIEMDFMDPSADLIDVIQHAIVWKIEIEIEGHRFLPLNMDIHTEFAETYSGPVKMYREVRVDGILAP